MHRGLLMSQAEKDSRHAKLHNVITTHTSQTWAMTLVKFLLSIVDAQGVARQTPALPTHQMLESYSRSTKRLFLLDYDVSLTILIFLLNEPIMSHPSLGYSGTDRQDAIDGSTN
jgi:trehalose 6-phosphate synthase/phosphatase